LSKKCGYKGNTESTQHSRRNSKLPEELERTRQKDERLPKLAFKFKPVRK
jgi:hypothetical protein